MRDASRLWSEAYYSAQAKVDALKLELGRVREKLREGLEPKREGGA